MAILFKNNRIELNSGGFIFVYDFKLASKLNKIYKKYENGKYKFQPGEEAIFKDPQIKSIDSLLAKLGQLSI